MVKYHAGLDLVFQALADPTRRAILERLAAGDHSVTELAEPLPMSLPAVSRHLGVLERAGLIDRTREGRVHRLSFRPAPLEEATRWMDRHRDLWQDRFDALARIVESKERHR